MGTVKAISLWQPWASAMALGLKKIETRHWWTSHRGWTAIHAAKRWQRDEREISAEFADLYGKPELREPPLGVIVAVGRLVDIKRSESLADTVSDVERAFGNYSNGRFGWLFEDIRPLPEPLPFTGAQGFFDVPNSLLKDALGLSAVTENQGNLL